MAVGCFFFWMAELLRGAEFLFCVILFEFAIAWKCGVLKLRVHVHATVCELR